MGIAETPVDELSGLPLLLVPDENALSILWGFEANRGNDGRLLADWNHAWHPARGVAEAGEGGPGLRNSRVQFVMRQTQHDEYHAYFDGPPLPRTPAERFRAMVLCAAGYIPPQGIAFGPGGPTKVTLSEWQRTRLRESGEVKVASLSTVQSYMKDFVLAQSVDHIKPKTVNRFLRINPAESEDAGREHAYLAHLLLSLAIDRVEDPLVKPYRYAHESELLFRDVPERPDQFILGNILRSRKNVRGIANDLARKLTLHRDGPDAIVRLGRTAFAAS